MSSIFSVQNDSFSQNFDAKKEAKESKKTDFANVNYLKTISQFQKIFKNSAILSQTSDLSDFESLKTSEYRQFGTFTTHLKIGDLGDFLPYDESANAELAALVSAYDGVNSDFMVAEKFMLRLMSDIIGELKEQNVASDGLQVYLDAYKAQIADKNALTEDIINEAHEYMGETNEIKSEMLYNSIVSKLQAYHKASSSGNLYGFFAAVLPYMSDGTKNEVAKALSTIDAEIANPTSFKLGGGNKLFWSVDEDRIRFKIYSGADLEAFHALRREAKAFETLLKAYEQSRNAQKIEDLAVKSAENLSEDLANLSSNLRENLANSSVNLASNSAIFNENLSKNLALNSNAFNENLVNLNSNSIKNLALSAKFSTNLSQNLAPNLSTNLAQNSAVNLSVNLAQNLAQNSSSIFATNSSNTSSQSLLQELLRGV